MYSRSPAVEALSLVRRINELEPDVRMKAAAAFIRSKLYGETNMPSFEDIANMPVSDVKPPPLLPPGTYFVGIIGIPELVKSSQKQTDGVAFKYKFFQAREDVDQDALNEALEGAGRTLSDVEMTDTFWVTDKSAFMLKQFLVDVVKVDDEGGSKTLKQMWTEAAGQQLLVHIRHRPRQDGSGLFAEIDARKAAA